MVFARSPLGAAWYCSTFSFSQRDVGWWTLTWRSRRQRRWLDYTAQRLCSTSDGRPTVETTDTDHWIVPPSCTQHDACVCVWLDVCARVGVKYLTDCCLRDGADWKRINGGCVMCGVGSEWLGSVHVFVCYCVLLNCGLLHTFKSTQELTHTYSHTKTPYHNAAIISWRRRIIIQFSNVLLRWWLCGIA